MDPSFSKVFLVGKVRHDDSECLPRAQGDSSLVSSIDTVLDTMDEGWEWNRVTPCQAFSRRFASENACIVTQEGERTVQVKWPGKR